MVRTPRKGRAVSRTFHWWEVVKPPEGKYVDYPVAMAVFKQMDEPTYSPLMIVANSMAHGIVKGLAQAGWEGASELDDAIVRHGVVELYCET